MDRVNSLCNTSLSIYYELCKSNASPYSMDNGKIPCAVACINDCRATEYLQPYGTSYPLQ